MSPNIPLLTSHIARESGHNLVEHPALQKKTVITKCEKIGGKKGRLHGAIQVMGIYRANTAGTMPSVRVQGKIKAPSHRTKSSHWVQEINRIVTHCGKSHERERPHAR